MTAFAPSDPMPKNWVFEPTQPVLDVEVSLLAAPGSHVDWVHGPRRDEAIRAIVDRCGSLFEAEFGGRIEHVRHSDFNHHGMTVHIVVAARHDEQVATVIERNLTALERTLETRLQAHFGWEQAAVSVQIEQHPVYQAKPGYKTVVGGNVDVYQPPGGSNAIAPVIVTMPQTRGGDYHALPYPPAEQKQSSSNTVAGWVGAGVAVLFAIFIAVAIGPLVGEIGDMSDQLQAADTAIVLREERIASLESENGRLHDTVSRLASRRGRPAMRSDQPTRALPDTDSGGVGPLAAASPSADIASGAAAP